MDEGALRSLVIVGGGMAGWTAASMIARKFRPGPLRITVIESEDGGRADLLADLPANLLDGSATPLMRKFNAALGIEENRFLAQSSGTFRLGTEFRDWREAGNVHFHGYGDYGEAIDGIAPHHFWLRLRAGGDTAPIDDWSLAYAAASRGRFAVPAGTVPAFAMATISMPRSMSVSCAPMQNAAGWNGSTDGSSTLRWRAPKATLPPSRWPTAVWSTANSSSIAPASRGC